MLTFQVPDELAMLEFLEAEPVEAVPEDGYWRYEVEDAGGTRLRLSFNTSARSLEITLWSHGNQLITVTEEGALRLLILGELLVAEFATEGAESRLELRLKPAIQVTWYRLVTE